VWRGGGVSHGKARGPPSRAAAVLWAIAASAERRTAAVIVSQPSPRSVSTSRKTSGRPPTSTNAFGVGTPSARRREPSPPARISACIGSAQHGGELGERRDAPAGPETVGERPLGRGEPAGGTTELPGRGDVGGRV